MKNYRFFYAVIAASFLFLPCQLFARAKAETTVPIKGNIILATTTSTQDSGLLDYILPVFTKETGWTVDVISVGTGAALQMGRDGQADVLLVHAKEQEIQFVADGHGQARYDVMYNDFIVVGPRSPIAHNNNITQTFRNIAGMNLPFVSRGDNSGTHTMELALWRAVNVNPRDLSRYSSVGQGMGATLQMTDEMQGFTLSDRATWLNQKNRFSNLVIVCEKSEELLNYYGVIAVNPAKTGKINAEGAKDFVDWILSPSSQRLIGSYGIEQFAEPLFTPNASR
ncbi:MAG: substrate-binding domain-containing protein [Treponema sp.]|jgi:tungstate transport system substrate-binding protein|nr:substrate-binding domain-containing protein [Treponema sp.]